MHPPKRPLQFLRWFCREDYLEEIEGDLTEVFIKQAESNPRQAKWKFTWSVMKYFRPAFMKSFRNSYQPNSYAMIKNYFKIGWRSLVRQKMYSVIKIGGFALGVAACLLIALFIKDELSYDRHYSPQIYRVLGVIIDEGDVKKGLAFPAPMAAALKEDFAEVKEAGRYNGSELFGAGSSEVRPDGTLENAYDEGFVYFDQALVNMLELPFIYGSPKTALSQPGAIVITKRKADKYFPNLDPVGKLLIVNNRADKPYTIGGVIEDFKSTSHIQFDFLIGTEGLEFWNGEQKNWGASNYATYIEVQKGVDVAALEAKISKGIIDKYLVPSMLKDGMPQAEIDKVFKEKNAHLELQPLQKVHLYSNGIDDSLVHGDIRIVWLFGGIALFVLLIAVINFVNLSTAKSANRAKEIGLRKAVGSMRSNIVSQFLYESILFSLISFIIGIALAALLLPYFNFISGKSISMPWITFWFVPSIVALAVMVGLLAGIYPSLYLSAFKPIQVLKGNLTRGAKSSPLRSTLVVFQFTTSIILIIGTVVIYRQMNFILNKKVGFDKEQVLLLQGTNTLGTQVAPFADELRALPQVVAVSTADYLPVRGSKRNGNSFWNEGREDIDPGVNSQFWRIDPFYINTLEIKLAEGRNFNRELVSDSSAIVINRKMAGKLGGNVLGKRIYNYAGLWTVVGIVEDFHFESLREDIQPLGMVLGRETSVLAVKLKSGSMSESIALLTQVWKKFTPHQPIRYSFLDERYAAMYADVQRMGRIFTSFAILAIVVSCLGLFALSAFMIEQRAKEIGIRLVMGASLKNIFNLLTFDFIKLVVVSIVIAIPLAWYAMQQWLQDFAYRVDITWQVFAVAGLVAVLIAVLTISYQSVRAGLVNPVKSLKSE